MQDAESKSTSEDSSKDSNDEIVEPDRGKLRVEAIKRNAANDNSMVPIRKQELDTAISELNRGKASGEDRIDNEHIVHSGPVFRKTILSLINAMLLKSHIPKEMKIGIIITLYKGGKKRKDVAK